MAIAPELQQMFDLRFFRDHGWWRKECPTCGDAFWTLEEGRTLCGDSTCEEYQFLGDPLTDEALSLPEMREAFLAYWEGHAHTRVPRNPVVARWRDDLYLNIASIANYQPHVTSGEVPPPANPLVVSQPCIRLNDLANIGRSGRHFSCFEMMGHHAFNSQDWGEHYWTEECVANGHRFLAETLGLDGTRITYKESLWSGGGNAGPCFEVFAGGLEVATLVFMCLEEAEDGPFDIKGERYGMMDLRIIDTGWGLERLAWASTGTPTAYDTVFPETIAKVRSLARVPIADDERSRRLVEMHARVQGVLNLDVGTRLDGLRAAVVGRMAQHGIETSVEELQQVMDPIESMYALCDHLRCLCFMVGDGIVPSNVKAGYLMRLVFRRALRFADRLKIEAPLAELLVWNMEHMLPEFPEFEQAMDRAKAIAELETQRFQESRERGLRLVDRVLAKKKELTVDDLVDLYDTHGLGPTTVAEAAAAKGVKVDVPDTFDAIVAERHASDKKTKAKGIVPADVPATRRIFYEDEGQWQQEFDAEVTWVSTHEEARRTMPQIQVEGFVEAETGRKWPSKPGPGKARMKRVSSDGAVSVDYEDVRLVTLTATCFFHDTGGQPGDMGWLELEDGKKLTVIETVKDGEHPVHRIADPDNLLKPGTKVHGVVDWDLRMDHTRSHTATHIMNQAVRRVLGKHSWQAGTQKYRDCARVDMSHFERPTRAQVHAIETLANRIVMQGRPVLRAWWQRNEAEAKWGTTLLQGGIPKGNDVRVVRIGPAPEGTLPIPSGGATGDVPPDEDFDVEYCGGTHCATTHQVGPVKIYRTERIQDGVERFEYSAGAHAVARWQADDELVRAAAEEVDVAPAELPNAVRRFFTEWKEQRKLLEAVQAQLAELKAGAAAAQAEEVNGVRLIVDGDVPAGAIQKTATDLIRGSRTVALLGAGGDRPRLLFARSPDVDLDMSALLREAAPIIGGRGGGKPDMAQGGGTDASRLTECVETAAAKVREALG